jgi:hypothetical protein
MKGDKPLRYENVQEALSDGVTGALKTDMSGYVVYALPSWPASLHHRLASGGIETRNSQLVANGGIPLKERTVKTRLNSFSDDAAHQS